MSKYKKVATLVKEKAKAAADNKLQRQQQNAEVTYTTEAHVENSYLTSKLSSANEAIIMHKTDEEAVIDAATKLNEISENIKNAQNKVAALQEERRVARWKLERKYKYNFVNKNKKDEKTNFKSKCNTHLKKANLDPIERANYEEYLEVHRRTAREAKKLNEEIYDLHIRKGEVLEKVLNIDLEAVIIRAADRLASNKPSKEDKDNADLQALLKELKEAKDSYKEQIDQFNQYAKDEAQKRTERNRAKRHAKQKNRCYEISLNDFYKAQHDARTGEDRINNHVGDWEPCKSRKQARRRANSIRRTMHAVSFAKRVHAVSDRFVYAHRNFKKFSDENVEFALKMGRSLYKRDDTQDQSEFFVGDKLDYRPTKPMILKLQRFCTEVLKHPEPKAGYSELAYIGCTMAEWWAIMGVDYSKKTHKLTNSALTMATNRSITLLLEFGVIEMANAFYSQEYGIPRMYFINYERAAQFLRVTESMGYKLPKDEVLLTVNEIYRNIEETNSSKILSLSPEIESKLTEPGFEVELPPEVIAEIAKYIKTQRSMRLHINPELAKKIFYENSPNVIEADEFLRLAYEGSDPLLKQSIRVNFRYSKVDKNLLLGISCRAYGDICSTKANFKPGEREEDFKRVRIRELMRIWGCSRGKIKNFDVRSSVYKIDFLLKTGVWMDDYDMYVFLFGKPFKSKRGRDAFKYFCMFEYFASKKQMFARLKNAFRDPVSRARFEQRRAKNKDKDAFDNLSEEDELAILLKVAELYSERMNCLLARAQSEVFEHESCIYARVIYKLKEMGIEAALVFDCFYSADPRFLDVIEQVIKEAAIEYRRKYAKLLEKRGYPSLKELQYDKTDIEAQCNVIKALNSTSATEAQKNSMKEVFLAALKRTMKEQKKNKKLSVQYNTRAAVNIEQLSKSSINEEIKALTEKRDQLGHDILEFAAQEKLDRLKEQWWKADSTRKEKKIEAEAMKIKEKDHEMYEEYLSLDEEIKRLKKARKDLSNKNEVQFIEKVNLMMAASPKEVAALCRKTFKKEPKNWLDRCVAAALITGVLNSNKVSTLAA